MEEDAIFDASLDDFAVSSSASPEIDHEYKNQSKQSQQNIELRRSSRLRSRFGLAESAETIDPVFGSRSEKSKHIKKVKDEHMNDSPSAHFTVNQGSPQHNESKTFVARSPMSRPPSTDSDKAALEASAQLRRSLDPNSPYINDNDGNDDNDDDDDDDDDGLDEVLFESTLRDPDADEVLDDYLERSLPVSLPTKMRLGLATGIGETDIASTELSFVSELADYDKQQESDDEDEVSMNGDNYDYDYDQENDVGDEGDVVNAPWESDAKLEMDVRDAMNGKLGASGSSGAPSRSESGTEDEMGNHGDVSTFTPEHSSREGSPDSWSPPGYAYTATFRKDYVEKQRRAQAELEKRRNSNQLLQQQRPQSDHSNNDGQFGESSGSTATAGHSPREEGVMLPPSRPILRVANPGSCTDRAEPNAKLQCLRSRSPSVERSVQHRNTIDCPSPAPTGNSIFNSISTSTAERTADPLQDAGERITPPCDAMPKPSLASPNGAIRNASLNRGSAKGAATPLKLSSSDVRPSARPELVSPLYARSRSQSRAQQKASSISPKRRQEEMMEQQFRAAAWLRDKSISPQILDNKAQNYARFTSRHSPSPPPLPPNPPGWLVSAISPKQSVSRSDPITQRNSGAGLGGDLSYHRNAIDDSSLDDLRLAASIPLPRGSSSASPVPEPIETNSHRKSSTPIEFEPAVPIKSRSSRSPTCDNEQTKRLSPPLETPSKKLVLQSSGRLNSLREKKHRKTRFIKSKKMMSLLMDGMVTAESASIAKTSDISSMQASLTTQRQHVSSQNRIKSMLSNVGSLRLSSVILVVMACLMIVMRVCFAPPAQRPIPDIEKLIDLARSLEPMIYYSDDGIRQLKHLQSAELAVWDLSESIRSTNMTSAMLISQELDDLSVNMKTLGTELTRFFAMVDGDIDTVLGTMEWARRQLETLTRLPSPDKSLIVSVVDGVHSFFGRVAVLDIVNPDLLEKHLESLGKGDRNDLNSRGWALPMKSLSPKPTAFGEVMRTIFGITWEQKTRKVLTQTFAELLGSLEEAITSELEQSAVLFSLFETMEEQFLRLSRHITREADDQEEGQDELLSALWSKIVGPNRALLRQYEKNRKLLSNLHARTVANKGLLMGCRGKLMALKVNLEMLRKKLVKPLLRPEAFKRLFEDDGKSLATDVVSDQDGDAVPAIDGASETSTASENEAGARQPLMSTFSLSDEEGSITSLTEPLPVLVDRRIERLYTTREYLYELRQKHKKSSWRELFRLETTRDSALGMQGEIAKLTTLNSYAE